MNKNILLIFCLCLLAGWLVVHLTRQVKNPVITSETVKVRSSLHSAVAGPPTNVVAGIISAQAGQVSNNPITMEPAFINSAAQTNVAADDGIEKSEQEKYRLLRELRELASTNSEGALAAAMKLPEGDERNQALAAVCLGLAQNDPADAVKMAKDLHLDEQPGAVLENLVQQWATTDSSAALDWANSQPTGVQRDGLTARIAYVMSQSDPASAANLIPQITPGPAQDEATMTVLNQWANQNLIAATAWANTLPEGALKARAVNELEGILNHQQSLAHQ